MIESKDKGIVNHLLQVIRENLIEISSAKVQKILIWCLGEFSDSETEAKKSFDLVLENVGSLPFENQVKIEGSNPEPVEEKKTITKTVILEDGSYGTETVVISSAVAKDMNLG